MRLARILMVVGLCTSTVSPAAAQRYEAGGGMVEFSSRLSGNYLYQRRAANTPRALTAVVLWRGTPDWQQLRSVADLRRVDSMFRDVRYRAEAARGSATGSGVAFFVLDSLRERITVEGRQFSMPAADSAIVIMVDHAERPSPDRVVTTAYIPATISEALWEKSWQSGDTLFFLRVPRERERQLLLEALGRSAVVKAFVDTP